MAHLAANSLIQNGRITLHPAPDGHVVNRKVPLRHDLLQVTVRERISQVPPDAQEDNHVFEMPPAEQCWSSWVTIHPTKSVQLRLHQNPARSMIDGRGGESVG